MGRLTPPNTGHCARNSPPQDVTEAAHAEDPPAQVEFPDTTLIPGSAPYANRLRGFKPRSHPNSVRYPATNPVVEFGRVQEEEHDMSEESQGD